MYLVSKFLEVSTFHDYLSNSIIKVLELNIIGKNEEWKPGSTVHCYQYFLSYKNVKLSWMETQI